MLRINNKKKSEADTNKVAIVISIIILLGGFLFSYNYVQDKKNLAYLTITQSDTNKNELKEKENKGDVKDEIVVNNGSKKEEKASSITYNYIGYLEIPKINLKRGFVSIDSKYNNVNRNLYVVKGSNYPDVQNGNLMIASHSGYGWQAFFHNLYKVNVGDKAYVTYNGVKYTYVINNIYDQNKTGTISVYRDYTRSTLTLITCTRNSDTKQTVYIAYLEGQENI